MNFTEIMPGGLNAGKTTTSLDDIKHDTFSDALAHVMQAEDETNVKTDEATEKPVTLITVQH
jgi:hypothetical protein